MTATLSLVPLFLTARLAQALIRDNWRCAVTGIVHGDAPEDIMSQLDPQTTTVSYTECAQVIPEATFFGVNPENSKVCGLSSHCCIEQLTPRHPV